MAKTRLPKKRPRSELVIITGLSGSGKATVLRALEDLGYYSVDNLPIDLVPTFAELVQHAKDIGRAALVIDVREGVALDRFPALYRKIRSKIRCTLLFLEADDSALLRRFSETRRPHPLGHASVAGSITDERKRLAPIRALADPIIDTSSLTVHQLRRLMEEKFSGTANETIGISVISFGYRNGLPTDADLVFDVRFLPNPNYVPDLRKKTGKHRAVAAFMRRYPQTDEFLDRVTEMLAYLIPHYVVEGKRYLTIAFGCTGGHHRSVMIADEVRGRLGKLGFHPRGAHRDIEKAY